MPDGNDDGVPVNGDLLNPYFAVVAGHVSVGTCRDDMSSPDEQALNELRKSFSQTFSWAIPNHDAIQTILEAAESYDGKIIDAGAGTGYWAWMIERAGGDVVAIDHSTAQDPTWVPVVQDDAPAAAMRMPDHLLLLVWPPHDDPFAYHCLTHYDGDTVAYVGEGRGACTADDQFHELLWTEWDLRETVAIPTFPGSNDRLEIWRRRK